MPKKAKTLFLQAKIALSRKAVLFTFAKTKVK